MSSKPTRKILFVDDNATFLDMIEKVFLGWSDGHWQFIRAPNAGRAMAIMEEQVIDLVVLDVRLPGVDGVQFLTMLHRRFSNIPKAILTAYGDPEIKNTCLKGGADVYIEKPRSLEGLEGVFATLNELSKRQPSHGFKGILRQTTLPEVLQLECLNKNSSILEVVSGIRHGQIYVQDGNIIHAQAGGHKGQAALTYLLSLKGGEFSLKPFSEPPETTISGSWEALIMEAAQASDEAGLALSDAPAKKDSPAIAENWQTEIPPVLKPMEKSLSPKDSNTTIFTDDVFAPRIEEMLVCSTRGKVLYDWQCLKPELRIELLEGIKKKTSRLSQILGAFERLDIKQGKDHIIVRFNAEHEMFVHVHHPAKVPTS